MWNPLFHKILVWPGVQLVRVHSASSVIPPFFRLHERLAGRETEHEGVNVVINETLAMHGILASLPWSRTMPCIIDAATFYSKCGVLVWTFF